MTQIIKKLKPLTVNTNAAKVDLKETESPFLKGYDVSVSKDGKANEGGNFGLGKKIPSNFQTIKLDLPITGINKTIGFYESQELNEAYVFNYNSAGFHGIYRLDGISLTYDTVCIKRNLNFSKDPQHALPEVRVTLRIVYGLNDAGERIVVAKYLIYTEGLNWQRMIDVIASIATNGFDPVEFPYYELKAPHFDADELIDYPVRPPMYAPIINPVIPNTSDVGKQNLIIKKSIQFAYRDIMTDGRPTALSWFSTPYFGLPSSCDANNQTLPRCLDLNMYAGSPLVEKRQILVRYNGLSSTEGIAVNSDWELYDTIYKYTTSGDNDPDLIGSKFWTRTRPWQNYEYNADDNTIVYRYCGDKGTTIFSTADALIVQNDVPLKSWALIPAGEFIMWSNNLRFYPNFPDSTLDFVSVDVVDIKSADGECASENVKISLYATFDSGTVSFKRTADDTSRYFCRGKINVTTNKLTFNPDEAIAFGLSTGTNDGFICYLAGTNYYAIGKQYKVDSAGNKTELGVVDITNEAQVASLIGVYGNGGYVVQQFDFDVPKGNYIARLAGHGAAITDDYELTSTYVLGVGNRDTVMSHPYDFISLKKEITLNAIADIDTWNSTKEIFHLFSPYNPTNSNVVIYYLFPLRHINYSQSWRMMDGYVRDNIDGISGVDSTTTIGVEMIQYEPGLGDNSLKIGGGHTDCNGFFFAWSADKDQGRARSSEVCFDARFNCNLIDGGCNFKTKININNQSGYFPHQNINLADVNSNQGNYILVKGRIVNCATGQGISSVGVTFTEGKTFYTDSDGNFALRLHTLANGPRIENIYINGNGNCLFNNCDCTIVAPIRFDGSSIPCTSNSERVAPALADIQLKIVSIAGKSAKGGGRYPVVMIGHDLAGRKTGACLVGYANVPTFLEKENFNASQIRVSINAALNINNDIKWITFGVGRNLNSSKYIQWVGDKIEFLDSKGNITADGNGAIRARVTIQSLLDFNIRENFNTTATYQFVEGDTVRFYDDGQGILFTPDAIKGYLDYQVLGSDFNKTIDPTISVTKTTVGSDTTTSTTANTYDPKSFIIEYDSRLLALKDRCGFWIEINRNIPTADNEPFFGVSGTYPVINGEIAPKTILLDFFDTYYLRRNIIISNCSGANFNHPFESQSISDYWGQNVRSEGMVIFKDDQAMQRWYLNESCRSDAFVNQGKLNGLGTCRTENKKDFGDQNWGGIVATHAERNIIAVICQNDWFITDFNMNYARVDESGRVIANPDSNAGIGNPYQKVGDNFGCDYQDISTIQFYNGYGIWADRQNSGVILMNYRQAVDLAMIDNKGYFIEKFKNLIRFNESIGNDLNNIIETSIGINPNNDQVYVSFRPRNGLNSSPVNFINNEGEVFYNLPETFIYNINLKKWVGWAPFVPEFYGCMAHAQSGSEFITFINGSAWFHNSKNTKGFSKFYGVDTDQYINMVSNFDQSKLKVFQSIAIESNVKYFIRKIKTDDNGSFSYLTLSHFVKRGNVWYSEFLRNMNTYPDPSNPVVSMLQDGKSINGNYCELQLVPDPLHSEEYSEINNVLVRFIGSEKSEK